MVNPTDNAKCNLVNFNRRAICNTFTRFTESYGNGTLVLRAKYILLNSGTNSA
jgi:hypothetical protein